MPRSDYQQIRDLGRGTFGDVFLVKKLKTNENLVMKVVDVRFLDQKQKDKAMNEVALMKKFRHPYIVEYKESFLDDNKLCIIMAFCDGGDLHATIEENKQQNTYIPEQKILKWLVQILLGLRAIHNSKCLHRDIKPQNLLLDKDGRLRIADFGVSKRLDSTMAQARSMIGTPYYFSPELAQGTPYAWASDMWAIGCLLYELAALYPPFHKATNMAELISLIRNMRIPTLPKFYSLEFQALVTRLLTRDPEKRATCEALLQSRILLEIIYQMSGERSGAGRYLVELSASDAFVKGLIEKAAAQAAEMSTVGAMRDGRPPGIRTTKAIGLAAVQSSATRNPRAAGRLLWQNAPGRHAQNDQVAVGMNNLPGNAAAGPYVVQHAGDSGGPRPLAAAKDGNMTSKKNGAAGIGSSQGPSKHGTQATRVRVQA